MPAFVIHTLGEAPQLVDFDTPPVRMGRDPDNDVVLSDETVSREHAAFVVDDEGAWVACCVSDTNPIVVNGALVTGGARVAEGSEVLIGSEHLVIFSFDEKTARRYLGSNTMLSKRECASCHWVGVVSSLRAAGACPRCAGVQFVERVSVVSGGAKSAKNEASTTALTAAEVREQFRKMQSAKRSSLERIDGRDAAEPRRELSETVPYVLNAGTGRSFEFSGIARGTVSVRWGGTSFVAESAMTFPGMKINGVESKRSALVMGDVIEVGSNRFRLVSG